MAYCSIKLITMDTMLSRELLQILACPACKGELHQSDDGSSLRCDPCSTVYPIVDNIPILLPVQTTAAILTTGEAK